MMFYVISGPKGYVVHQGDEPSCRQYINNVSDLFGHRASDYTIAKGAKNRDALLKLCKR